MSAPIAEVALRLLTQPSFYDALLRAAVTATEEASPDFTVGHHAAAVVGHLLGMPPVSTPDKASERAIPQAILDGFKSVGAQLAETVGQAAK